MTVTNDTQRLEALLDECAGGDAGIILYTTEHAPPERLSYRELRKEASHKARCLRNYDGVVPGRIILVHFHTHRENMVWFWASILAGCVPAMSTPFVNNREGRISHLAHLHRLLLDPIVVTSKKLLASDFAENTLLRCVTAEIIENLAPKECLITSTEASPEDKVESQTLSEDKVDSHASSEATVDTHDVSEGKIDTHSETTSETILEYTSTTSPNLSPTFSTATAPSSDDGMESSNSSTADNDNDSTYGTSASSVSSIQQDATETKDREEVGTIVDDFTSLEGVAALMLTSGSTGAAKAVCLSHEQILTACKGKLSHMPMAKGAVALNWIGLDHVGSLTELHISSMLAGCDQVQVPTTEIIADPLLFLRLLSKHKVTRTFAPNFMMAKLLQLLEATPAPETTGIDLSNLLYLISGGEPNSVETCVQLSAHFQKLGAPTTNTITPGFGMTETCAGSIYSLKCPEVDVHSGTEFTALGTCVPGIEMRVSDGGLQIRGPIVFQRYFNNAEATQAAFTADGWFRTGDNATIDASNTLRLVGRSKDLIIVNGVKYLPHELETAIDQAEIPGVALSHVVCFAYRPAGASTELIQIIYQREYDEKDGKARMDALQAIIRTVVTFAGARPRVLPLAPGRLERSTLGKLSRAKVRTSLLNGDYQRDANIDDQVLQAHRDENAPQPGNPMEEKLTQVFRDLELGAEGMGIDTPILDTGVTSVDLIRLKRAAETAFEVKDIPIITIMTNTTIRTLAAAISQLQASQHSIEYDPIVTLQPNGDKTPLFLVHPGIGEMLVFLGLVQYFPDRPIYAMRARGLNEGEDVFTSQEEVVTTYHRALKAKQPHGPYAIAGYSYGSMLAFEIGKTLEANGDRVQFLGSFNLPPHIKTRMRTLDWTAGMVHIAHFCSIITEQRSEELMEELRPLPHAEQVRRLLAESDPQRCADLALTQPGLHNWTDVSWSLQKIGWDYEPSGDVANLDIFYCQPLKAVASNRVEYRKNHLNHWVGFIRDDLKFWEVDGEHYTMIGPEHVPKFQQTLKKALAARGL